VLVIDDSATCRHVLNEMLTQAQAEVFEADSGSAGLKAANRARSAGRAFQFVLLDKNMPGLDGFATARQLIEAQTPPANLILLLPSENLREDVAACRALGIPSHLVKPIKQSDLWKVLMVTAPPALKMAPVIELLAATAPTGSRLNILLADDNLAGQLIGQRALEKMGHTVRIASNGREALQQVEAGRIDLVLMDVEMPDMDGLEATRQIRQREAGTGRHTPIVAVTAYAMKEDQERCLAAGVDDYLAKPLSPAKLANAIDAFWSSATKSAATAPQVAATQVVEQATTASPVNLSAALEVVDGDRDLLRESVQIFLTQDYVRQLADLREAIELRDALTVKRAAHGIKGALSSFGGWPARDLALRLETMGREENLADAASALHELEAELDRFAAFYARPDWD
jgi:CheY-like chemotaxis protein